MAFIAPTILLLTGMIMFLFTKKKRHLLFLIAVSILLIIAGTFIGFSMGYFLISDLAEQRKHFALRGLSTGFLWSIFGIIAGVVIRKKLRETS